MCEKRRAGARIQAAHGGSYVGSRSGTAGRVGGEAARQTAGASGGKSWCPRQRHSRRRPAAGCDCRSGPRGLSSGGGRGLARGPGARLGTAGFPPVPMLNSHLEQPPADPAFLVTASFFGCPDQTPSPGAKHSTVLFCRRRCLHGKPAQHAWSLLTLSVHLAEIRSEALCFQ